MDNITPGVIPMIPYEDGVAAMEWLTRAFGFEERERMLDTDGRLTHGEMMAGQGIIMLASPTPDYECPRRHQESCASTRKWLSAPWIFHGVLVYIDDVDSHYRQALATGASILTPPEDGYPARRYRVADLEGHRWMFMEKS